MGSFPFFVGREAVACPAFGLTPVLAWEIKHRTAGISSRASAAGPSSLWPIATAQVGNHCIFFLLGTCFGAFVTVWIFLNSV